MPPASLIQRGEERPFLRMASEAGFYSASAALMKRSLMEELVAPPRPEATAAQMKLDAIQNVFRCSAEDA
eukprot:12334849-Prorocentrum_lima.AAC.1